MLKRSLSTTATACIHILYVLLILLSWSCGNNKDQVAESGLRFSLMEPSHTNIEFNNKLVENDSTNFLINQYIYIGSGVGVGDFNNDGLQDLYFAGGQVNSKLYINKGNFEFEDITEKAGLLNNRWCTGVSIVDINSDGLQDIYVCVTNSDDPEMRRNLLYVNQGNLKFQEQAKSYGLDDPSFSTQAAFFDYDKDGDLDMYLMNHNVFHDGPNNFIQDTKGSRVATDKLFRNEGVQPALSHPVYKDVSQEAGIGDIGYGLGIAISDLNNDGWPDVYVANDFISNDLLWLNNKNGTFTNTISRSLHHQSYNSMGVDAADLNNDLLPELAVLDMQPETNTRKKTMFAGSNPERYEMEQKMGGYEPQYPRNMLQLNQGTKQWKDLSVPFFSEIAHFAGMAETDWSWSILMADFDNDGWKDMHITNGLAKDLTNNDFLMFRHGSETENSNADNSVSNSSNRKNDSNALIRELDSYGSVKAENYLFHNNGNLTFSNISIRSGLKSPSVSHGAAQVDLDNDGDLDLVINNMNQDAFIWRNELRQSKNDSSNNFISIQLKGSTQNPFGIGAKLTLYNGEKKQFLEQNPIRGYLSSVDYRLHFGIGDARIIDSIKVVWPDLKMQVLKMVQPNRLISLNYRDAQLSEDSMQKNFPVLFANKDEQFQPGFKHNENSFFDFGKQRLLPHKYSQLGPPLAVSDVNNDGLEDFFIGGGAYQTGHLYIQKADGSFTGVPVTDGEKLGEDAGAVFFDADNDKDQDLLICSGSSEYGNSPTLNIPRLFLNDGKGRFSLSKDALPAGISTIAQVVTVADYDGDNDEDIFIGGRILVDQYPNSPRSYLLQNDHGRFTDVTSEVCKELENPGLITAAEWADINNDHKPDLVLCGELMSIRFFENINGKLKEVTEKTGLKNMDGMWRSLKAADLDKDGDIDFVAGNIGLNNKFHPTVDRPFRLYANDFDKNGSMDLIPAYYIKNEKGNYELFPGIDRTQFSEELIFIKKKYLLNETFSKATMENVLEILDKKGMIEKKCETTASIWIENKGYGVFISHQLPQEVQFAPVNSIAVADINKDGFMDLLLGGNEYQAEVSEGRYDASYGLLLSGSQNGSFQKIKPVESGFIVDGNVRQITIINKGRKTESVLVSINNDSLKCFQIRPLEKSH
jgi:hypothetical protein